MSQTTMVLKALKRGEKLTPLEAWKRYGIARLAARAYDLRRKGVNVISTIVDRGGARVAQYSLKRKAA